VLHDKPTASTSYLVEVSSYPGRSTSPHLRRRITVVRSQMMCAVTTHTRAQHATPHSSPLRTLGAPAGEAAPQPAPRVDIDYASHAGGSPRYATSHNDFIPVPTSTHHAAHAAHAQEAGGKARQPAPRWNTSTMHRIVLVLQDLTCCKWWDWGRQA
jgi:hypothetical protein